MVELIELFCNIAKQFRSEKQMAAEFFKNSSRIPMKILSEFRLEKHKKVQNIFPADLGSRPILIGIKLRKVVSALTYIFKLLMQAFSVLWLTFPYTGLDHYKGQMYDTYMPTTPGYLIHFSRRKREGKRCDSEGLVRAFGLYLVAFRGHAYGPLRP